MGLPPAAAAVMEGPGSSAWKGGLRDQVLLSRSSSRPCPRPANAFAGLTTDDSQKRISLRSALRGGAKPKPHGSASIATVITAVSRAASAWDARDRPDRPETTMALINL